jgi:hypothetical protein
MDSLIRGCWKTWPEFGHKDVPRLIPVGAGYPVLTHWAKFCRASGAEGWKLVGGVY